MNPHSGMTYELFGEGEYGDPPAPGAKMDPQTALANGVINFEDLDAEHKEDFEQMLEARTPLVAVDEQVVQKLRLGERELRRRKQRRR